MSRHLLDLPNRGAPLENTPAFAVINASLGFTGSLCLVITSNRGGLSCPCWMPGSLQACKDGAGGSRKEVWAVLGMMIADGILPNGRSYSVALQVNSRFARPPFSTGCTRFVRYCSSCTCVPCSKRERTPFRNFLCSECGFERFFSYRDLELTIDAEFPSNSCGEFCMQIATPNVMGISERYIQST